MVPRAIKDGRDTREFKVFKVNKGLRDGRA
jgi:hypothetical protein